MSDRYTAFVPDRDFFHVEVSDHDGQIVCIEPGMLCGREITPALEAKIRAAIDNLIGFVGSGSSNFEQPSDSNGANRE